MASATDEPIASTSKQNGEDISIEEIEKLMLTGKKHYVNKEINLACEKFEDACSKLATKYGQTANECGEAYFYYGKSLLDIARAESDVLGNALPKEATPNGDEEEDEEMEEDVKEDESGEEAKDDKEMNEEDNKENEECKEEAKPEDEKEEKESKDITSEEDQPEEGEGSEEGEEDEEDKEVDPESKDEVTNMQLAWEMLELSRIIFARQDSKEMKMKQAEANLVLGEIGLELEHYPEAIGDFMECLRIQEQILQPDDRLLAETFYNLGLAYSFDRHYGKSIEYFHKAIKVIELRISNLTKQATEDDSNSTELKDLRELIPDITAKVEDAEYMKKSTEEIIKTAANIAKESLEEESESGFDKPTTSEESTAQEVKVTNIGHLVRKKRKTDDEETDGNKKSRPDEEQQEQE